MIRLDDIAEEVLKILCDNKLGFVEALAVLDIAHNRLIHSKLAMYTREINEKE